MIDTGTSGEAFVTSELVTLLSLPQTGRISLSDPSGQGTKLVDLVDLTSLEVAGISFSHVKAAVHSIGDDDCSCQGLLGFALFRNFLFTLDYPKRQMELSTGSLTPDAGETTLTFRMPIGIPVISLSFEHQSYDAQLDSGGTGLSLPEQLAERLRFVSVPLPFSNSHSLLTKFQVKGAQLSSDVRFGSYTFRHPFVEINPAFPLVNFGSCAMQKFRITFDQKSRLVRLLATGRLFNLTATPLPMRLEGKGPALPADHTLVPLG